MASLPAPEPAEVGYHGSGITAAVLVVVILASIAVALRFVARYIQRIGYGADDVLILLALVCISTFSKTATSTDIFPLSRWRGPRALAR